MKKCKRYWLDDEKTISGIYQPNKMKKNRFVDIENNNYYAVNTDGSVSFSDMWHDKDFEEVQS